MISSTESPFTVGSPSPGALGSALAAIGRDQPVVMDEHMGAPLVLRHRDVSAALRNPAAFSTRFYGVGPMADSLIAREGSDHALQRRIHNRFFSPAASARYAAVVAPIARAAFGGLAARGEAELIEDVIARYPMKVFLSLLNVPDELGDQGLTWVREIMIWLSSPMNAEFAAQGTRSFAELQDYTTGLVERERVSPSDSMLGEIVKAHLDEGGYSAEAVTVAVVSLLLGGFETTVQLLTATVASLLLHPEALQRVRADPSLVNAAFDEAFRWANPTAGLYRQVVRDIEIAGEPVLAGGMVYLAIAAAHFDADAFPDPERFVLGRTASHLGFGLGAHYCVGAPLARIEARAALSELLAACPGLRLDPSAELSFRYGARGFPQHGAEALHVLTS
ncbi:cytochrome P450 [Allocatelliglobosispora scoriae]|uniref:Cytochrome P450 n=1 Tax=Allocatelliglobosispora scoriae TaxID=643052 RepID=A0A841C3N5_9ACTN|nr:cytochrome P450 [Allocatelliglobosispora scoriae]MBB5874505.1 cytochrome P450 [Allocatelliglobosispora scoriae]